MLPNRRTTQAVVALLRSSGREVRYGAAFAREALRIDRRRRRQDEQAVAALRARYERPIIGRVHTWELVERLATCIDPSDCRLLGVSQQVHVLQMLAMMEHDGIDDADLQLTAILHDLGKLALATGEDPANVVGRTDPVLLGPPGAGLERTVLQWGHAELAYERFRGHVPDQVAWVIRYHNTDLRRCAATMHERDRAWAERYLRVFAHYDARSKSLPWVPPRPIDDYRDLVEKRLPDPILF